MDRPGLVAEVAPTHLGLDGNERRRLTDDVTAYAEAFLHGLADAPASHDPPDPALIEHLLAPPPESGGNIGPLLESVMAASRTGFDTAAGSHLSFIPSGGIYLSALGRFLAAVMNRWTGASFPSPGSIALEQSVINRMIRLFGLGPASAGILLSGGSSANLEAMVTARSRLGDRFDDAVVYTSAGSHHSVEKAARLAGIPVSGLRRVPVDGHLRLDTNALEELIGNDTAAGLRPMMIVATAGTTDTGAIDPLSTCADIAARHDLWFHVDAAYGGFFILTDRIRRRLDGIDRADSITVDAHKSLMMPFGLGGLLVADGDLLLQAHEGRGAYMQDVMDHADLPHYFGLGPEMSRPFRGLDVWLPLHYHGTGACRAELDRMLDLAQSTADRLRQLDGIELAVEPELSIVTFRSVEGNERTERIFHHLNRSRQIHVSSTMIDDRFIVRIAFLNHRTTTAIAERAIELVEESLLVSANEERP